jgi:hypothetical protein
MEMLEDTKRKIRSRISRTGRQYNDTKKKDKGANSDVQNMTHKTKRSSNMNPLKTGDELGCALRVIDI